MAPETTSDDVRLRLGLVGARGHTGQELLRLVAGHPDLALAFACSRSSPGAPVPGFEGVTFEPPRPELAAERGVDVLVLALPNGTAAPFVDPAGATQPRLVIDLSADHRFDDGWTYGLPEHDRGALAGAARVANPGCYATALQLAVRPLLPVAGGEPACFGVSGYSGAGTKPSERNDPEALRDAILPYALADHLHEREASRHLGAPVRFAPSVASFFRGIVLTALVPLAERREAAELAALVDAAYADAPLVETIGTEMPRLGSIVGRPGAIVGGVTVDEATGRRAAVVCVLDNLLKGAAAQAIQNVNRVFGLPETRGLS